MRIAVYLGWIRHNACGGVESYTRNLLDGFAQLPGNEYVLICSKDNYQSFMHYGKDERFEIVPCSFETADLKKSLLFESFVLDKLVSKYHADLCFVPTYRMPLLLKRNKFVVVIHDLQVCHFPNNFTCFRRSWIKICSKISTRRASKIITISDFVKNDVINQLGANHEKLTTIHNPVLPSLDKEDFSVIEKELNLKQGSYLYSVSSLAKHKNVITLLRLMKIIKENDDQSVPRILVVSGIGLHSKDADNIDNESILNYVKTNQLENNVIFTGFVSNERRNALIKNSAFFLFPSLFEGFGMPPIEAMMIGAKVITTRSTSLPEVTHDKAYYVDDPLNENEWLEVIKAKMQEEPKAVTFDEYVPRNVAKEYLRVFESIIK